VSVSLAELERLSAAELAARAEKQAGLALDGLTPTDREKAAKLAKLYTEAAKLTSDADALREKYRAAVVRERTILAKLRALERREQRAMRANVARRTGRTPRRQAARAAGPPSSDDGEPEPPGACASGAHENRESSTRHLSDSAGQPRTRPPKAIERGER
jgi:hypothetical protein